MGASTGLGSLGGQTDALQAREERMLQQMKSKGTANDSAKIDKGAREFEAILLGSWLQQAEQSFATVPGGGNEDEDASGRDQMMSLGVQSLASSMAAGGGIGIAKIIGKAMHASEDKAKLTASASAETVPSKP